MRLPSNPGNGTAVGLVHMKAAPAHHKKPLLIIHLEEADATAVMVDGCNMPVVREDGHILGILAAYRQTADHGEES